MRRLSCIHIHGLQADQLESFHEYCRKKVWSRPRYDNPDYWFCRLIELEIKKRKLNKLLSNPTKRNLIDFFQSLWAFNVFTKVEEAVERRTLSKITLEELIKRIKKMIELGDIDKVSIPGLGQAIKSEILYVYNPEKYPLMNKRSVEILNKILGINIKTYRQFVADMALLASRLSSLKEQLQEVFKTIEEKYKLCPKIPIYDFIDGIIYLVHLRENKGIDTGLTLTKLELLIKGAEKLSMPSRDNTVSSYNELEDIYEACEKLRDELKRLKALYEAVVGVRPSALEILREALKIYKSRLIEELKQEKI